MPMKPCVFVMLIILDNVIKQVVANARCAI